MRENPGYYQEEDDPKRVKMTLEIIYDEDFADGVTDEVEIVAADSGSEVLEGGFLPGDYLPNAPENKPVCENPFPFKSGFQVWYPPNPISGADAQGRWEEAREARV